MSDFGGQKSSTEEPPPFLSTYSRYSGLWDAKNASASAVNAATATWTTTNMARYYPVSLPFAYPVRRVFWINGTAATNNRTFAIYNADYQQLYTTGATGASGRAAAVRRQRGPGCRPVTTTWLQLQHRRQCGLRLDACRRVRALWRDLSGGGRGGHLARPDDARHPGHRERQPLRDHLDGFRILRR